MSKQIQFRRGSESEHETFTGAIGEITVDTTNKTIRVHDGETAGGTPLARHDEISDLANADYVIEFQKPTAANNYVWYRKYKSGWVEQGGKCTTDETMARYITIPLNMNNLNYHVNACVFGTTNDRTITANVISQNKISVVVHDTGNEPATGSFIWIVYGFSV